MQSKQIQESPKNFTESIAHLDALTSRKAQEWLDEGRRVWVPGIVLMMIAAFLSCYFHHNKRKQGVPGRFESINALMLPFLTYAKYWEYKRSRSDRAVRD